jgi:hypothetical protein
MHSRCICSASAEQRAAIARLRTSCFGAGVTRCRAILCALPNPPESIMSPIGILNPNAGSRRRRTRSARAPRRLAHRACGSLLVAALCSSHAIAQTSARRSATGPTAPTASTCVAPQPILAPARIDRDHLLYVEQETVTAQSDGRVLVAGRPVFLWARRKPSTRAYDLNEQDTLMGMTITPPSRVRPLPSPIPGRPFAGVRSAPLPDGWWLVTFAEVIPAPPPVGNRVIAMWAAETDGSAWRALEKLPPVADSLFVAEGSELVWRNGRVLLAIPATHDHERRVVVFARDSGRWSARSHYFGTANYVAVASSPSRDILAVVRLDTTERADRNSLFIYSKLPSDSAWSQGYRLVRGLEHPVRDPILRTDGDLLRLSWRSLSVDQRERTGMFVTLNAMGDSITSPATFARDVQLLYYSARGPHGVWVTSDYGSPASTLRFVERAGSAPPTPAREVPTTYRGLVGLAVTKRFAVVIASQVGSLAGDPAVISIIQSHPWRCQ